MRVLIAIRRRRCCSRCRLDLRRRPFAWRGASVSARAPHGRPPKGWAARPTSPAGPAAPRAAEGEGISRA
eukprot:5389010-Pyramimonas_sp.AAC.1